MKGHVKFCIEITLKVTLKVTLIKLIFRNRGDSNT